MDPAKRRHRAAASTRSSTNDPDDAPRGRDRQTRTACSAMTPRAPRRSRLRGRSRAAGCRRHRWSPEPDARPRRARTTMSRSVTIPSGWSSSTTTTAPTSQVPHRPRRRAHRRVRGHRRRVGRHHVLHAARAWPGRAPEPARAERRGPAAAPAAGRQGLERLHRLRLVQAHDRACEGDEAEEPPPDRPHEREHGERESRRTKPARAPARQNHSCGTAPHGGLRAGRRIAPPGKGQGAWSRGMPYPRRGWARKPSRCAGGRPVSRRRAPRGSRRPRSAARSPAAGTGRLKW